MSFRALSEEILVDIVKWAGIEGDIESWRNLACVNRTLNRIATPMLYTTFTETTPTSVSKFLWTVVSNSQLATYIRIYTGNGNSSNTRSDDSDDDSNAGSVFTKTKLELCRKSLKRLGIAADVIDGWIDRIEQEQWHALTSLVLLHLPNLEDLELCDYRPDLEDDMSRALTIIKNLQNSKIPSQFSLPHLTNLTLSPFTPEEDDDPAVLEDEPEFLTTADIFPFIEIASIYSLSICRLSDDENYYKPSSTSTATSTIKELELNDTSLNSIHLIPFLRRFTCLQKLTYEHGPTPHADFLPQDIGKAISHLQSTLESLTIIDRGEENGKYTTPRDIGSLAKFEKLKRVEMDDYTLLGYPDLGWGDQVVSENLRFEDILPAGLEVLDLGGVGSDVQCDEERLWGLLRTVREGRFGALIEVKMRGFGRYLKDPEGLKRAYEEVGLRLLL